MDTRNIQAKKKPQVRVGKHGHHQFLNELGGALPARKTLVLVTCACGCSEAFCTGKHNNSCLCPCTLSNAHGPVLLASSWLLAALTCTWAWLMMPSWHVHLLATEFFTHSMQPQRKTLSSLHKSYLPEKNMIYTHMCKYKHSLTRTPFHARPIGSTLKSGKAKSGCGLFVGVWDRCFNLKFLAVSFFFIIPYISKFSRHIIFVVFADFSNPRKLSSQNFRIPYIQNSWSAKIVSVKCLERAIRKNCAPRKFGCWRYCNHQGAYTCISNIQSSGKNSDHANSYFWGV